MPESTFLPPDQVLSSNDPGDETGRRYRYQWTYSAILACSLLDETKNVSEIYCEHHEDTLVKHIDGLLSGIQVKTRASTQPAWTASDEQFVKSCVRFSFLDTDFPGHFARFIFLTNHAFQQTKKNGKNVVHILDTIHGSSTYDEISISVVKKFVAKIAKQAKVTTDSAFQTLKKTKVKDSLPKLDGIELQLVSSLHQTWDKAQECTYSAITKAAKGLAAFCMEASTLSSEGTLSSYISQIETEEEEVKRRIEGKRITKAKLLQILEDSINETIPLAGDQNFFEGFYAGNDDLLCKKLDAGGFSAVSRNSALNLRDKAEYLGTVWSKKSGEKEGIKKYDHIQSLVLADAASAFEEASKDDKLFGKEMLDCLRHKLQGRQKGDTPLYDCSQEHLEGFAYSLTARCKVQWSIETPWEDE